MKETTKKTIGLTLAALAIGGAGVTSGFLLDNPEEVIIDNTQDVYETAFAEGVATCPACVCEVPEPQVVEKEVIVNVTNPVNEDMLQFIQDNVDEDVDEDYILFEIEAKVESEAYVHNNIVDLLDRADFFDNREVLEDYRKNEISIKKIGDAEILDRDFEDKDLELQYEVKVRAKEAGELREYFDFVVTVPFDNGVMQEEDISIEQAE